MFPLKSGEETSEKNQVKQLARCSRAERVRGRRREEFGLSGHGDAAAVGGVDVSEVVLQRRDLLGVLLRGEDLRGELSQLRREKIKLKNQEGLVIYSWDVAEEDQTCDQEM